MIIDKQQFLANLHLTQVYCARQLQSAGEYAVVMLRSLNPAFGEEKLFCYKENNCRTTTGKAPAWLVEWHPEADPYDNDFIKKVFERQLIEKKDAVPRLDGETAVAGEIMIVEYALNIADGTSAVESEGFVDCLDFPPIDTWFHHSQDATGKNWVLFAWVPTSLVALAQEAIEVHFLGITQWFKDWSPVTYHKLIK